MTEEVETYENDFDDLMSDPDPFMPVVLKGHLLIERILNDIVSSICFHPAHIWSGRLSFFQKVNFARAFARDSDKHAAWALVFAINALRNEVAHKRLSEVAQTKIDKIRELWLAEVDEFTRELDGSDSDPIIIIHAVAFCANFLTELENELKVTRSKL